MKSAAVLMLFMILCLSAGYLGSVATSGSLRDWYPTIAKPAWTPPDAVFAPVWSTLFVMMAIAAWLVWRQAGFTGGTAAFILFGLQLGLNVSWSLVFFGMQRPGAAFVEIIVLWLAILATLITFGRHSYGGALLLTPYLTWVTFAAYLNFAIWRLNN